MDQKKKLKEIPRKIFNIMGPVSKIWMKVDLVRKSEQPVQMRSEVSQSNDLSIKKQLFYQF